MTKKIPILAFDATQFRNVPEILRLLDKLKKEVLEDSDLVDKYQAVISGIRIIAASSPFVVTDDTKPNKAPTNVPRKPLAGEKLIGPQADIINRYADKLDFLTGLEEQLQTEFKNEKMQSKAIAEIRAMKKLIVQKLNQAHATLSRFAKKQAPKEFLTLVSSVTAAIKEKISDNFDSLTTKTMVNFSESSVVFFHYIQLKNFVNDEGFVFGNFYVILCCQVDGSANLTYFISTSPSFVPPAKVKLKYDFTTDNQALEILDDLFELEKFTGLISDSPNPFETLNPNDLSTRDSIEKVVVGQSGVVFLLKKTANQNIDEVLKSILAELRSLSPKRLKHIRYRIEKPKSGRLAIHVVFPNDPIPALGQEKITRAQLRVLQNELGLSDEQVKKIIHTLST